MTRNPLATAVALGFALAGSAGAETVIYSEPEVRTIVVKNGYGDPISIVRDGDMWRARSIDSDGPSEVTVFIDAEGKVLGAADVARIRMTQTTTSTTTTSTTSAPTPATMPTQVTKASVEAIVNDAGFHNVHDVDMLDSKGVWKAEADDSTGQDYELHVDALSGRIVHIEND